MSKILVVAALIVDENKFLVTKRARGELRGFWEFPGGKVEKDEIYEDAIIREIKEELDLDIYTIGVVSQFEHKYPFAHIDLTLIKCKLRKGTQGIQFDGSHTAHKWIELRDSELLDFAPLDSEIVLHLHQQGL